MQKNIFIRSLYSTLLFISVFFFPWWATVSLSLFGAMIFERWYECVIAGVLIDILYGTHGTTIMGFPILFTVLGAALFGVNKAFNKLVRV